MRVHMYDSLQHPRNSLNQEIQTPWYLALLIQVEILVQFEFVPYKFKWMVWFNLNLYRGMQFLDLEVFGGVAFPVEVVIQKHTYVLYT